MSNRKNIPKSVRNQLWIKYNINSINGKCPCGKNISMDQFVAGHIIAVVNGGKDNILNLYPICNSCNTSMGTQNLIQYFKQYLDVDIQIKSNLENKDKMFITTHSNLLHPLNNQEINKLWEEFYKNAPF